MINFFFFFRSFSRLSLYSLWFLLRQRLRLRLKLMLRLMLNLSFWLEVA